jgi:hypothetical protein
VQQAVERENAAFAVILGAQHQQRVLDRDDERDRPYRQGYRAQHVIGRRRDAGGTEKNLVDRIERRGADIAIDDTERADDQRRYAPTPDVRRWLLRGRDAGPDSHPKARIVHQPTPQRQLPSADAAP